jgi:hypothetical protein
MQVGIRSGSVQITEKGKNRFFSNQRTGKQLLSYLNFLYRYGEIFTGSNALTTYTKIIDSKFPDAIVVNKEQILYLWNDKHYSKILYRHDHPIDHESSSFKRKISLKMKYCSKDNLIKQFTRFEITSWKNKTVSVKIISNFIVNLEDNFIEIFLPHLKIEKKINIKDLINRKELNLDAQTKRRVRKHLNYFELNNLEIQLLRKLQ